MIPFIRSLTELTVITQSRGIATADETKRRFHVIIEDSGQRKRYIRSKEEKAIELPNLRKTNKCNLSNYRLINSNQNVEKQKSIYIQKSKNTIILKTKDSYDHLDVA